MDYSQFLKRWGKLKRNSTLFLEETQSVYRYSDVQYIEEFFQTGRLKLSSFNSNRIAELSRRDSQEGKQFYRMYSKDRSAIVKLGTQPDVGFYTFCTSKEFNPGKFYGKFNANGCFEITDIQRFSYEIAKSLKDFILGVEGEVVYTDKRHIEVYLENYPHSQDFNEETSIVDKVIILSDITAKDHQLFFRKPIKYKSESEYRMVFRTLSREENLYIDCPNAIKYCHKLY